MVKLDTARTGIPLGLCTIYFVIVTTNTKTIVRQVDCGTVADNRPRHSEKYIQIKTDFSAFPNYSVVQSGAESTLFQCVRRCGAFKNCDLLTWDSFNRHCSTFDLYSGIVTNRPTRVTPSTLIYERAYNKLCPFNMGYQIRRRSSGQLNRCLFLSTQPTTFKEAQKQCAGHGARLFKSNTLELIALVIDMAVERGVSTRHVRIGLDDIETENNFVWSDGSPLTNEERGKLFLSPQPDNFGAGEDCGTIALESGTLNDYYCHMAELFVCEMECV